MDNAYLEELSSALQKAHVLAQSGDKNAEAHARALTAEIDRISQIPAERTAIDRAARVAGMGARAIVEGLAAPSIAIGDMLNQGANLMGANRSSVREGFNTFLTNAGLPAPENGPERLTSAVLGGMSAAGGQLGMVNAAREAPGAAGALIRDTLLQQPARQIAAGGTAGAASQATAELGGGPVAQTVAGLVGGMAPFAGQLRTPTPEALRTADTAQVGRYLGYVFPPSESNPGVVNNALTGRVSGRAATEQIATIRNQPVTNARVKQDLGIPQNQAVTVERLRDIRNEAGMPYRQITNMRGSFTPDNQFRTDIDNAVGPQRTLAGADLGLEDRGVLDLAHRLQQRQQFDGATLIELTKDLRERQTMAFRAGETGVGRFYGQLNESVERMMERNLTQLGRPELLEAFRAARQRIAQTYTAEAALNDATGNLSARTLARQFDAGMPMSGNMRLIGRVANAFGGAMQDADSAAARQAGGSVLDTYGSMHGLGMLLGGSGAATYTHNPAWAALAALPLIRPAVRSAILSGPYQDMMAIPNTGANPIQAGSLGILSGLRGN